MCQGFSTYQFFLHHCEFFKLATNSITVKKRVDAVKQSEVLAFWFDLYSSFIFSYHHSFERLNMPNTSLPPRPDLDVIPCG